MLMRNPPGRGPEQPPRPKRDADAYLLAAAIVLFVVAVLIVVYALFVR